jgi:CelD/BcsL family acetyltransferase involved in cellulose biosynthesis
LVGRSREGVVGDRRQFSRNWRCGPAGGYKEGVDIELVTTDDRLDHFYEGWEALAERAGAPRSGAALVSAWSRHVRSAGQELRVWVASEPSRVVGVVALATERLAGGKVSLGPAAASMARGVVPIADPGREAEVAAALAAEMAGSTDDAQVLRIDWVPQDSPWADALAAGLELGDWVAVAVPPYQSQYIRAEGGAPGWLQRRSPDFRNETRRRERRAHEAGYRAVVVTDPEAIAARVPVLQALYHARGKARGGGYQFDERMVAAITEALTRARPGRFSLAALEGGNGAIGLLLSLCGGPTVSTWLITFDATWSRLGPGIATIAAQVEAAAAAGQHTVDLSVGHEAYKLPMVDGTRPLRSCIWVRRRLARMMQFEPLA